MKYSGIFMGFSSINHFSKAKKLMIYPLVSYYNRFCVTSKNFVKTYGQRTRYAPSPIFFHAKKSLY